MTRYCLLMREHARTPSGAGPGLTGGSAGRTVGLFGDPPSEAGVKEVSE